MAYHHALCCARLENMSFRSPLRVAALTCSGGLFGFAGAWGVWNFVYSIGARVIEDDHFAAWESSVAWSGCGTGALVAFISGILSRSGFGWLVSHHVLAVFIGCYGATTGWRAALLGYFATVALGPVVSVILSRYSTHVPNTRNAQ
jgi:hypothetical protein